MCIKNDGLSFGNTVRS